MTKQELEDRYTVRIIDFQGGFLCKKGCWYIRENGFASQSNIGAKFTSLKGIEQMIESIPEPHKKFYIK